MYLLYLFFIALRRYWKGQDWMSSAAASCESLKRQHFALAPTHAFTPLAFSFPRPCNVGLWGEQVRPALCRRARLADLCCHWGQPIKLLT